VVTFIDDFSRYVSVYTMKAKSEVLKCFAEYRQLIETQTGATLKCLRTDNGGEYTGKDFQTFCSQHGIVHQTTTPYTPQQNGLAERMNRTIVERARAMLYYQQVDKCWWAEAVMTAVYLTNRIPNTARSDASPFEVLWKKQPTFEHLRVFGSRGFMHVDKTLRSKWQSKAHKCMLLGYAEHAKAYRVWDFDASRIATVRTIAVDEHPPSTVQTLDQHEGLPVVLPLADDDLDDVVNASGPAPPDGPTSDEDVGMTTGTATGMASLPPVPMDVGESTELVPGTLVPSSTSSPSSAGLQLQLQEQVPRGDDERASSRLPNLPSTAPVQGHSDEGENRLVFQGNPLRAPVVGRTVVPQILPSVVLPDRQPLALPPSRTDAQDLQLALAPASSHDPPPSVASDSDTSSDGEPDPKRPRLTDSYEIALAATDVPLSYREAMASPDAAKWKEAIRAELRSHIRNHTWDIVRRPPGMKVIGSKWVFALKRNERGEIVRFKARLVALGFLQTFGIDYHETSRRSLAFLR
jgi:hypothetical protein